jgi:hypothetical protein
MSFNLGEDDPMLVAAIKQKLRHWIVDRDGLFLPTASAQKWADLLIAIATQLGSADPERCSIDSDLCDWISLHTDLQQVSSEIWLEWSMALEQLASEIQSSLSEQ